VEDVTALTLHGDAGHAVGTRPGRLLLALLARAVLRGRSALVLLSGIAGTLAAAWLVRRDSSPSARSTAVFALWSAGRLPPAPAPPWSRSAPAWRCWRFSALETRRSRRPSVRFLAGLLLGAVASRLPLLRSRAAQNRLSLAAALCRWLPGWPHFTEAHGPPGRLLAPRWQ